MKISPFSSVALLAILSICAAGNTPEMQWNPATVKTCIEWYDNNEGWSCEKVRDYYNITPEQFSKWNPSVGLDCKPWMDQSYCIVTEERWNSTHPKTSTTAATETPTTTSTSLGPSPTAWESMGCYAEDPKNPILEQRMSSEGGDPELTIPKCQNTCYLAALEFAGVKAGNECWCSSYVGGEWAPDPAECNMPCSGDKSQICGGVERLNIYQPSSSGEADPTVTSTTSTTTPTPLETDPAKSGAAKRFALFR